MGLHFRLLAKVESGWFFWCPLSVLWCPISLYQCPQGAAAMLSFRFRYVFLKNLLVLNIYRLWSTLISIVIVQNLSTKPLSNILNCCFKYFWLFSKKSQKEASVGLNKGCLQLNSSTLSSACLSWEQSSALILPDLVTVRSLLLQPQRRAGVSVFCTFMCASMEMSIPHSFRACKEIVRCDWLA